MTIAILSADHMSDQELLARVLRAATCERHATVQLIALLMELDARKLYLAEGCSSLFTYCRRVLHLSEHAAYGRIEAARAARQYPVILERLAEGALHLTAIGLLAPHLTHENHLEVLNAARHKSKREVEELVARLRPKPDVPAAVRKLPERQPAAAASVRDAIAPSKCEVPSNYGCVELTPPRPPAEVKPLAPERYKIQFTVSRETYQQLRRAQDLMRHTIPDGDPGVLFERALALLVRELEKTKLAATDLPRSGEAPVSRARHIPAAVKRAVWQRDGGRCAFQGSQGRCTETGFLEFHHVVPFAAGGEATNENISLRCRTHNQYEADREIRRARPAAVPGTPRAVCDGIRNSVRTGRDRTELKDSRLSVGQRWFISNESHLRREQ